MVISSNDPKIRLFGVTNNPHLTADQQGNKISNAKIKAHDWTHLGDTDWKVSAVSEWVSASQVIQSFHLLSELTQNVSTFPSTTQKYHYFFQKNKNKKPELFWFFFHDSFGFHTCFLNLKLNSHIASCLFPSSFLHQKSRHWGRKKEIHNCETLGGTALNKF